VQGLVLQSETGKLLTGSIPRKRSGPYFCSSLL